MLVRVEDHSPRARLDEFRQLAADGIGPFESRIQTDDGFRGEVLSGPVGMFHVTRITAPPLTAVRTPRLIRASDPEQFKIDVQLRGHTVFAQGGREAALNPGDFTLVDLSRPSQLTDRGHEHEVLVVRFPHAALPLQHDELARLTAVRLSGSEGLGAPISSLALHLVRHLDEYAPTDGARLAAALMDLLIVALAQRLDRGPSVSSDTRRRALLTTVQASIERRLGDPTLSPSTIAAENHISLRYLHKLFESQQMTVAGWIRQRRLERCRRDLQDPALSHLPVRGIAARWGLVDAAHFSRVFRAAYGIPPGEYRLTAA